MHSHLIPGIDDGAKEIKEAVVLVRKLKELGYSKLITTPHVMGEYYLNTPEIIGAGLAKLQKALAEEKIDITISAAAEYNIDEHFEALIRNNEKLLTFSDNYLLIELSTFAMPGRLHDIIFQLRAKGYKVVLAHPERYLYLSKQLDSFKRLKDLGVFFQVNLLSLAGHYGQEQKKLGIKMLEENWIEFLGTDTHRLQHIDRLASVFYDRKVDKLLSNSTFMNLNL